MRPSDRVRCQDWPCTDVDRGLFSVPTVEVDPARVSIVLVSEVAAPRAADGYYATGESLFARTTLEAFRDAGANVTSITQLLTRGIYLTTAVKCGKTGYGIETATVTACSGLLEKELSLSPTVRALLLMGDVAIKAVNAIARRAGEKRVIPAGSTYKLRGPEYSWRGARVFPSYLQAAPSFFIEKEKRRMIAEDLAAALALLD